MSEVNNSLKKVAESAEVVFISLIIMRLLGYVYRLIIARYGIEEYGLLSLGLAMCGILIAISALGLQVGLLRYIPYYLSKKDDGRVKGAILFSIKTTLLISLIIGIILFGLSDFIAKVLFHNERLSLILKILAFSIPVATLSEVFAYVIRGFQKIKYYVYSKNFAENTIKIILTLLFILLGWNLFGISLAYVLAILGTLILSFYFVEKKIFNFLNKRVKAVYSNKELLKYSLPLTFNSLFYSILSWSATLVLGYFWTAKEVGIYNAALPTAELMYVLPFALMSLFLPVLTELYTLSKKEEFKTVYRSTTKWTFITNIILLSLFILFSKQIISILFGEKYILGSSVLVILSFGYFINYMALTSNNVLMVFKRTKLVLCNTLLGAISCIILSFILTPYYGIIGAALATSASFIIMALLFGFETYFISKINPYGLDYLGILICNVIAAIIVYFISKKILPHNILNLAILGILFVLIYIGLLFITKSFEEEDKLVIKSIFDRLKFKISKNS